MCRFLFLILSIFSVAFSFASSRQDYTIYVDGQGIMRRSDTNAEVSYYGTNYTTPFAHAYRAIPLVGADRKATIDLDVAHMKRLGFNGFRLHLWDAELADADGNLLANDHLDLLDYLIARLEEAGIDIILTAQTNFGNGYPERNIDTGAFTYDFDKCDIHANPAAQAIQERYLKQLVGHLNPYTGLTYSADKAIIAIEINNEPCHTAPAKEVTRYIDRMARALRHGGFDRIILYNVSHNGDVVSAYYQADIQGTTYQWYPDGLVAGHERQGNLLPYVDAYPIPWSKTVRNYDRMARLVYEFDPGDVLCTYLYPAVVRTFRAQGFQWATQFAYDPTPLAPYNTEYQTHFLNLLYTPGKALGMMIAGRAMRRIPRNADFGKFPADTVFGGEYGQFRVSYDEDLATFSTDDTFIYTNNTDQSPADPAALRHIAGCGNSPLVKYPGSGAYFLDRIDDSDSWQLEIMPDVAIFEDPFQKTSLRRPVAALYYAEHPITLSLPGLPADLTLNLTPGKYTLSSSSGKYTPLPDSNQNLFPTPNRCVSDSNGIELYENDSSNTPIPSVIHTPQPFISTTAPLRISAKVFGDTVPAKVVIYPSDISFWRENNTLYEMTTHDGVNYSATIPTEALRDGFTYNIVVEAADGKAYTYPARTDGTPLDWDVITTQYYTSSPAQPAAPFVLYAAKSVDPNLDICIIPEEYSYRWRVVDNAPYSAPSLEISASTHDPSHSSTLNIRQYVGNITGSPALHLHDKTHIEVITGTSLPAGSAISLISRSGLTYSSPLPDSQLSTLVPLSALTLSPTPIIPAPYPGFLPREFVPDQSLSKPFSPDEIEFVLLSIPLAEGVETAVSLQGITLR